MTFVDGYFLLNRLNLGVPSEICTCNRNETGCQVPCEMVHREKQHFCFIEFLPKMQTLNLLMEKCPKPQTVG